MSAVVSNRRNLSDRLRSSTTLIYEKLYPRHWATGTFLHCFLRFSEVKMSEKLEGVFERYIRSSAFAQRTVC